MRVNSVNNSGLYDDAPKYRKKTKKNTPKKADHAHEYESVILSYINKYDTFSPERGFVTGRSYAAGRRCTICGQLTYGFAGEGVVDVAGRYEYTDVFGRHHSKRIILPKFSHLPVVEVKNYWNLKEENHGKD